MNTSFYNGISGIKTYQSGMDVLASNILNIDTIGYKGSDVGFSTVFSQALSGSGDVASDIGLGSKVDSITINTSQGVLQNTDNVFDLALNSEGWFGVQGPDNNTYYTRAGLFGKDADGYLTNENGDYLLGTLGNNINPTTLDQSTLESFGQYYNGSSTSLADAYAISNIQDITLGNITAQSKIQLPDLLYFPAVATTNVSYHANLDPTLNTGSTQIDINSADISSTIDSTAQTISVNGTISNTTDALDPQPGDKVLVTLTDSNGNTLETSTALDSSLNWNLSGYDISSLDAANPVTVSAKLQTTQEIPNTEHFTSTVISPTGESDILDMTFTKRVPQQTSGTTWDAQVMILAPAQTYDPTVTYDPTQYKVDTTAEKVYPIIDSKSGVLEFAPTGELLSSTVPTLSNSGTDLTLDLGTPGSYTGLVSSSNLGTSKSEQHDGYEAGILKDYGMDDNGNVVAEFTNGRSVPIAKVAVYHFQNDQGLEKVGNNLFSTSQNSGNAFFYTDTNGNNIAGTKISPYNLESSNVDTTTALTELIVMQKAFDASAKSITTSDQMIQNAINMKK